MLNLKQRTPSVSNLNINSKKIDDDKSILKKPSNVTPQLLNYASIVIATFSKSLIPFTIYKSSSISFDSIHSIHSKIINISYQCSSAVVISEILKLIIAIFIVFNEFEYDIPKTMETMLFDVFQVHTFAVSGILYAISNVITIKMISEIGMLYIYYSIIFKICFTTFFWKIVFNQKKISNKQWISIGLIIISIIFLTFEYNDSWSYFPFIPASIISQSTSDINTLQHDDGLNAIIDVNDLKLHENGRNLMDSSSKLIINNMFNNYWFGFLFIEALFASIASVTAEQKYKTSEKNLSYFAQSSSMYLWSFVTASILFYIANIKQASKQLLLLNITYALEGFNIWTWILIIIYVLYGYSSNYLLKYENNMLLLLLLSVAICFSHILIYWITNDNEFITSIGLLSVVADLCVAVSVLLYSKKI